jgi:hypothetical protein
LTEIAEINLGLCAGIPVPDRSKELKLSGIVCIAITLPIIVLRCLSRWLISRKLWWDDLMICIAAVHFPKPMTYTQLIVQQAISVAILILDVIGKFLNFNSTRTY